MNRSSMRRFFRFLNRLFMVPMFRLGLGALIVNPVSGYIMVLKTVGRKTGKARRTPLNYALLDGCVYCVAGWGTIAHWYRNLQATPNVEILLPGGSVSGNAEPVDEAAERVRAIRQVMKNGGFAGFFMGFNPWTAPDSLIQARTSDLPVVRIRPTGIGSGAGDPGGWMWLLILLVCAVLIVLAFG